MVSVLDSLSMESSGQSKEAGTTIILILKVRKLGPERLNASFTHLMNKYGFVKRLYHCEEVMAKITLKILN